MNGGITGCNGGQVTTVSNQSQLEAALKGDNAKIIKVNGIITLNADVSVSSNTSIIGANKNSGFTGTGSSGYSLSGQYSTNIWIDHCELYNDRNHGKDYYDGLIDLTHTCDFVTISWNYLHDHYKATLIGHSDSNTSEDTGKLHI